MEVERECWKVATMKRKAWAVSRDSWQASLSQDEGMGSAEEKAPASEETGRIPSKIASWLKECRTPLGASLDEQQNSTTSKGVTKNGCSFEDDLSLGAEANHLQPSSNKAEPSCFGILAKEKRSHFQQKGRSMNSTGSGKSSTTVSSVSELLDLYEEDPEKILYNLGFGTEEPDIASKVPSRFFSSSSQARGIDIKLYLGAQQQRQELENPSYGLTSRFRQIEVLTTVANAFSSLYSQVSGLPVQQISSCDADPKEVHTLNRSNSAKNAAKILKKSITKLNLLASNDSATGAGLSLATEEGNNNLESKNEQKQQKFLRKKDTPSLTTVTEEEQRLPATSCISPRVPGTTSSHGAKLDQEEEGWDRMATFSADKEYRNQVPNPRIAHLLLQTKDSFEMEEVQSVEGENLTGTSTTWKLSSGPLLRMSSQHSDSSGFADDPTSDCSANHLKVQESSDSCDSEATVTSISGEVDIELALDHSALHGLSHPAALTPGGSDRDRGDFGGSHGESLEFPLHRGTGRVEEALPETTEYVAVLCLTAEPLLTIKPSPKAEASLSIDPSLTAGPVLIPESTAMAELSPTAEPALIIKPGFVAETFPTVEPSPTAESRLTIVPGSKADHRFLDQLSFAAEPSSPSESGSTTEIGFTIEPGLTANPMPVVEEGSCPSVKLCGRVWLRDGERFPLQRSSSLPTTLLSSARIVSSVRIQLRSGEAMHCSPPRFSYLSTPKEGREVDVGSTAKEVEEQASCRSTLIINHPCQKGDYSSDLPPHPLYLAPGLAQSSSSLHSASPDWFERPLGVQSRAWSTCSVPNLTFHKAPYHTPFYTPSNQPHCNPFYTPTNQTRSTSFYTPSTQPHNAPYCTPYNNPYSTFYKYPYHCNPIRPPFNTTSDPHSTTYTASCPNYQSPSYSLQSSFSSLPSHGPPTTPSRLVHSPSDTEVQLRQVLHDIQDSMQNLTQLSSLHREDNSSQGFHPQKSPLPVNQTALQELQGIRRGLHVFRTRMLDLEQAHVRQQTMVYQHLSDEERQEVQQLQYLRSSMRQELHELELQLEDRLLTLDKCRHSSRYPGQYPHHVDIHSAQSMDSLSVSSHMNIMEPVSELLREQRYLRSELGHEGRGSATPSAGSGQSSRSPSPARPKRTPAPGVYRASVSLTPVPPARSIPEPAESADKERASDRSNMQQLIQEIKENIVQEVRQEILSGLLAVVSPRRHPIRTEEFPS